MSRIEDALRQSAHTLRAERVKFAVVGGLAVSARVEPRFTRFVDLAVAVEEDAQAEALVQRMQSRGYRILAQVEQEATGRLATVRLAPPRGEEGLVLDLLFASSGIEPEVVRDAEDLALVSGLVVPVARLPHLLALKVLARNDRTRPQDRVDILALMEAANSEQLEETRQLLSLIQERGFGRDKRLDEEWRLLLESRET